jgi:glycosyltransferase involved in cell wall biosynthesis
MSVENLGDKPLVSVLMITYLHEQYIEQAIRGVLDQVCNFKFELIIADDCSPDNTSDLVKSIISSHPIGYCVKYTRHNQNIGMNRNADFVIQAAGGKYIAICEGDDFWTDPTKLQNQVDFLENNEDYGLVHHEADYFFQAKQKLIPNFHKRNKIHVSTGYVFEELLRHNNIYTPTVMYRKQLFDHYSAIDQNIRNNFLMTDYTMWLEFSLHSKFHYINKSMTVYRVLANSASRSTFYEQDICFVNSYCDIKKFFLKKYGSSLTTEAWINNYKNSTSLMVALKYKKYKNAKSFASQLKVDSINNFIKYILAYTPIIFKFIIRLKK